MSRTLYVSDGSKPVPEKVALPALGPHEILVRPRAVAFNPCDWKTGLPNVGGGMGCDFSGDVAETGSSVTKVKVGDAVAGMLHGGDPQDKSAGAFSDMIKTSEDIVIPFPNGLVQGSGFELPAETVAKTYESAASFPLSTFTVALAINVFNLVDLVPNSRKGWALVYGATTSAGYMALQLLQYVGYDVIAVASSKNHAFLSSEIGAKHLVDYHNADWPQQVRDIAGDDIELAFDTVSSGGTTKQVLEAVSKHRAVNLNVTLPQEVEVPKNVKLNVTIVFFINHVLVDFGGGATMSAPPGVHEKGREMVGQIGHLVHSGVLKSLPLHVVGEGLSAIPQGMQEIQKGASCCKIVVRT